MEGEIMSADLILMAMAMILFVLSMVYVDHDD
ncbi:hypothetical protein J2850_004281 [Azospirillum picis]|uniref:Uncharacterized protein n=1 Tax=Azospirillum picis TaxID=488438 RepID=A0ABU0MPI8_9PROT|nr:hypothetical protein [Azospirillum picis]MDQ0535392.1 hypothetical protein [Azospirillum picis]